MYGSIEKSLMHKTAQETSAVESDYEKKHRVNDGEKKENLRNLRPNLSNPSCKEELDRLDEKVVERFNRFVGVIDATQFELLNLAEGNADVYFKKIENTTKAGLIIYSSLLFHDDFIALPGDDISEKKHMSIKKLMIQKEKEGGYAKGNVRGNMERWKGLPKKAFVIDYKALPEYKTEEPDSEPAKEEVKKEVKKEAKKDAKREAKKEEPEGDPNFTEELKSMKTAYHKALIKQRNESFKRFQNFFNERVGKYFALYNSHRTPEYKFKESWEKNVAALRSKQQMKS